MFYKITEVQKEGLENFFSKTSNSTYWVGQTVILGFSCKVIQKNLNKLHGQPNILIYVSPKVSVTDVYFALAIKTAIDKP